VVALLLTGLFALGLIPQLLDALTREQGSIPGFATGVFWWGIATYSFGALIHRLVVYRAVLPTLETGLADFFAAIARGYGIGVTVLDARVLGDALGHFGDPPKNGTYIADAFFFVLVTLIISAPGLLFAVMAKWMR